MNKKLQTIIDQFSGEIQSRLPGVTLDVWPAGRKLAYIYMMAPREGFWDDDSVLDAVDAMGQRQVDTLVDTGYAIRLLRRSPKSAVAAPAFLRDKSPEWGADDPRQKG